MREGWLKGEWVDQGNVAAKGGSEDGKKGNVRRFSCIEIKYVCGNAFCWEGRAGEQQKGEGEECAEGLKGFKTQTRPEHMLTHILPPFWHQVDGLAGRVALASDEAAGVPNEDLVSERSLCSKQIHQSSVADSEPKRPIRNYDGKTKQTRRRRNRSVSLDFLHSMGSQGHHLACH